MAARLAFAVFPSSDVHHVIAIHVKRELGIGAITVTPIPRAFRNKLVYSVLFWLHVFRHLISSRRRTCPVRRPNFLVGYFFHPRTKHRQNGGTIGKLFPKSKSGVKRSSSYFSEPHFSFGFKMSSRNIYGQYQAVPTPNEATIKPQFQAVVILNYAARDFVRRAPRVVGSGDRLGFTQQRCGHETRLFV